MTSRALFKGFVRAEPMPAPRPRAVVRGRFASVYMDGKYMVYKDKLAEALLDDLGDTPDLVFPRGPVTVVLTALSRKPRTSRLSHPRPDVDNLAKGFLDAVNDTKAVWADDSQVVTLIIHKRWAEPDEEPGFSFIISPFKD